MNTLPPNLRIENQVLARKKSETILISLEKMYRAYVFLIDSDIDDCTERAVVADDFLLMQKIFQPNVTFVTTPVNT
jgi:hypothetical protein